MAKGSSRAAMRATIVVAAAALALSALIVPALRPHVLPELLLAAVAASAWYGGVLGGLVAIAVLAGAASVLALPPWQSSPLGTAAEITIFVVVAFLVAMLRRTVRAVRERAAATARDVALHERRLRFLAETSRTLGGSLAYEPTLEAVARLAVPFLADCCIVDIREADDAIRCVALQHVNPEKERIAHEIVARYPLQPGGVHPTARVLETGRAEIVADASDALARSARDAGHRDLYRRLGVTSAMCVPLVAHGRVQGAMTFYVTESVRHYGPDDLALAEDVGARCAGAIDNARLYREAQREIAERAQAEARLRESEERLQLATDAAHIGTWDWHVDSGEVHVDWPDVGAGLADGARGFSGSIDDLLGRIHPDDRQAVQLSIARSLADGSDYEIETRVVAEDGGARWVAVQGKAMKDEGGRPVRLIGVAMDVTERKRAAQRLAAQHATTRILAECASLEEASPRFLAALGASLGWVQAGVWRVDATAGVLRFVDGWHAPGVDVAEFETASRTLALTRGVGLPGRVWATGQPSWIPDVVRDANFPRAAAAARVGLHAALGFPVRVRNAVVAVLEFFSPRILPPDDALLAMIATVGTQIGQFIERAELLHNVQTAHAEARGAERRAAFLGDATAVLSASLDHAGIFERLARLAVPYLADWCTVEVPNEDGTLRRVATAHVDAAAEERLRQIAIRRPPPPEHPFRALLRAGRPVLVPVVAEDPFAGLTDDPETLALARALEVRSFMIVPLFARGRGLGAMAFGSATPGRYGPVELALAEELAQRGALALDNARLYRESQDATRRKDEFLAMLGHELRNPLAAISGAVHVLDRISAQTDAAVRQRGIIARQTSHLSRLVDDLLDVSRVVSGKITLKRERVELNALVSRCLQSLTARIDARRQESTFVPAPDPVVVDADPVRLEQVVCNLIDNAIKYTPPEGSVRVTVERSGDEAIVRVRDTGMGIAAELLPRVFDMFAQAHGSLDRAQGGLGLGLTLVRRLTEQHGGSVAARSAGTNRGSEFIVSLPLASPSEAVPEPAAPRAIREPDHPGPARHVLVVDDNVDGRDALRALLELGGHRVDVAEDGPSGIDVARRVAPDVALIDIGLPGLDGYQVAQALRAAEGRRIRLIAITGYGQPEDRQRALDAGFDAHLVKPVDVDELARVLAEPTSATAA
jgi:signal transduction histidine kinase/PAS domain-containing protein/ActR/RegA family two-component response regulator